MIGRVKRLEKQIKDLQEQVQALQAELARVQIPYTPYVPMPWQTQPLVTWSDNQVRITSCWTDEPLNPEPLKYYTMTSASN